MLEKTPSKIISNELEAGLEGIEQIIQIAQIISKLEGVKLTRKQEMGIATIGGAMGTYDKAFDDFDLETSKKQAKVVLSVVAGNNENMSGLSTPLRNALIIANETLNPRALQALRDLTQAQINSIKQREGLIDEETLKEITRKKGAKTALLFALEVNPNMDVKRQQCYEELGYLIQLVDDLADKDLDSKDKIITLANITTSPIILNEIVNQNKKVRSAFASQYEAYKLTEIFSYTDKLLASVGILG